MSLTTQQLDYLAAMHDERRYLSGEAIAELIEYARERAAREACCVAGDKPGLVSLTEHSAPDGASQWEADWLEPFRIAYTSGFQPTPTEAYLALFSSCAPVIEVFSGVPSVSDVFGPDARCRVCGYWKGHGPHCPEAEPRRLLPDVEKPGSR